MLFFDSRISHDGWMSCHSCHTDGHSSGQLNDNLSDGSFGAPKRVLSLLGVADTHPWAWTGDARSLEEQVSNSINKTMQGVAATHEQIEALVAYLKTLPPPPRSAVASARIAADVNTGRKIFDDLDCRRCHTPPSYTSPRTYDVGLTDEAGNSHFNPPSLRGVGRRKSLLHDGRAKTLSALLTEHKHQLSRKLSATEVRSLLEFLQSI